MAVQTCCFFFVLVSSFLFPVVSFFLSFFFSLSFHRQQLYTRLGRRSHRITIESSSSMTTRFCLFPFSFVSLFVSPLENVSCLLLGFVSSRIVVPSWQVSPFLASKPRDVEQRRWVKSVPRLHSISLARSLDRFLARFLVIGGWNRTPRRLLIQWPHPLDTGRLSCTDASGTGWSRSWWDTWAISSWTEN